MLFIGNYAFNKFKPNDDETISYRCKYYQTNGASCTIRKSEETGNDCLVRKPKDRMPPSTINRY